MSKKILKGFTMIGSLWTGIAGLAGQQAALDNESNNIANVNTVGYKAGRISFADQIYQNKIGKGSKIQDTEKLFTQGNLRLTGVNYDVALSGDGFFTVQGQSAGGTPENFYTRSGNFRQGENGTLQDTGGNSVVGWSVAVPPQTTSTDPNIERFNNNYTKLLASSIIKNGTSVESIVAKATDYEATATNDDDTIYAGAGKKTRLSKIKDIEELLKAYSTALNNFQENPNTSSIGSTAQISSLDLPGGNGLTSNAVYDSGVISADGDEVYVFIDGNRYAQAYIASAGTDANNDGDFADPGDISPQAQSYINTMKAFADKISEIPGLKAYVAANNAGVITPSTENNDVINGILRIESSIPGKSYNISSVGMISGNSDKPGVININTKASLGQGLAAVLDARDALSEAVTGKQRDVYTSLTLGSPNGIRDYSYQITVYDKSSQTNVVVPSNALTINNPTSINDFVTAINTDPLSRYIQAQNINGALVIETLDSNFDVEFNGNFRANQYGYTTTVPARAGINEEHTFDINPIPTPNNNSDFSLALTQGAATIGPVTFSAPSNLQALVTAINNDATIGTAVANGVTASIDVTTGNLVLRHNTPNTSFTPQLNVDFTGDGTFDPLEFEKDTNLSGREGAGAEFLELKTRIDQTTTRSPIQLRLDRLITSDNPFGEFSVDSTGLVTILQDGATFAVGQMSIAKFITNRGLEPVGDNLFRSTIESGDPIYNINNDKAAKVESNTLELSTADLSESLVNLVVFQRAFEANAKSITTADTILNTLIQLKR